jgi:hypothetical protein
MREECLCVRVVAAIMYAGRKRSIVRGHKRTLTVQKEYQLEENDPRGDTSTSKVLCLLWQSEQRITKFQTSSLIVGLCAS